MSTTPVTTMFWPMFLTLKLMSEMGCTASTNADRSGLPAFGARGSDDGGGGPAAAPGGTGRGVGVVGAAVVVVVGAAVVVVVGAAVVVVVTGVVVVVAGAAVITEGTVTGGT